MKRITISGVTLDPLLQRTAMTAAHLESVDAGTSDSISILTQLIKEPLSVDQKNELASKGIQDLGYVPENTYFCQFKPTDVGCGNDTD